MVLQVLWRRQRDQPADDGAHVQDVPSGFWPGLSGVPAALLHAAYAVQVLPPGTGSQGPALWALCGIYQL